MVCKTEFILVLLFIDYCIISHTTTLPHPVPHYYRYQKGHSKANTRSFHYCPFRSSELPDKKSDQLAERPHREEEGLTACGKTEAQLRRCLWLIRQTSSGIHMRHSKWYWQKNWLAAFRTHRITREHETGAIVQQNTTPPNHKLPL